MNLRTTPPSSYSLLPVEIQLLKQPSEEQKRSYLPSLDKLELVRRDNQLFVASIQDSYQYLRMLLFGIFMEAYTKKPELLIILKKVIYGGDELGDSSFEDSNLVKLINQVPFDKGEETERAVMRIFVDTADVEIVTAFEGILNKKNKVYERLDECISCIEQSFRVKIQLLELGQTPTSQICYFRENDTILKSSIQLDLDSNIDSSRTLPATPASPGWQISKNKSNQSIDSIIMKHNSAKPATPHHVRFILNPDIPSNPPSPKLIRSAPHSSLKNSTKSQWFSIWEYFCC